MPIIYPPQTSNQETLLRALLLSSIVTNQLLGGKGADTSALADEMQMQDVIVKAIATKTNP